MSHDRIRRSLASIGRLSIVAGAGMCSAAGAAAPPLQAYTETIPGTAVTFEMAPVPAGEVVVADPEKPGQTRTVTIGPLWVAATETTWDQYDVFVYGLDKKDGSTPAADAVTKPSKPYLPPDRGWGHSGYPAMCMTYTAAQEYCRWLSAKTGRAYRLPTEAEWAYICEQGRSGAADLDAAAWHAGNARGKTHPVGEKAANALGVHDMLGNVAEWCTSEDGKPVTRGGSYAGAADTLSCETRALQTSAWNASDPQIPKSKWWLSDGPFVGFRVVCEPEKPVLEEQQTQPGDQP